MRNTNGCIAGYDRTNRASFDNVEAQIREFLNYQNQDVGRPAGNDKFKSPSKAKRSGVLLSDSALKKRSGVSGLTSKSQDNSLDGYDEEVPIQKYQPPIPVVLVGAKLDLVKKSPKNRAVPYAVAYELAQRLNLAGFYEVSSKTSNKADVDDCFMTCLIQCLDTARANLLIAAGGLPVV